MRECTTCVGTGVVVGAVVVECPRCFGTGKVEDGKK